MTATAHDIRPNLTLRHEPGYIRETDVMGGETTTTLFRSRGPLLLRCDIIHSTQHGEPDMLECGIQPEWDSMTLKDGTEAEHCALQAETLAAWWRDIGRAFDWIRSQYPNAIVHVQGEA